MSDHPASSVDDMRQITETYSLPIDRIKRVMDDPLRSPVVLVACGSFSPITIMHLRMFEMAADFIRSSRNFELVGGYISPVSDEYKKKGLVHGLHRYESQLAWSKLTLSEAKTTSPY
jgi:hypothetical protein